MTYAVMQTGEEPPPAEALKNALAQVPGLTPMDAGLMVGAALGVLANGFALEQASALQAALAAQGVEIEVVEEGTLGELPPPRQLTKLEFTPEALRIDNYLGQILPLEWKDMLVIAAGRVTLTEFNKHLVDKLIVRAGGAHGLPDGSPMVKMESVTVEERREHLLLEIITRGSQQRYHAVADQPEALLLFQCLGARRTKDAAANLRLLVQDLCKFAPGAVLNHGAFFMREDGQTSFTYPNKTAFYREITWLLWMISTGRVRR